MRTSDARPYKKLSIMFSAALKIRGLHNTKLEKVDVFGEKKVLASYGKIFYNESKL